MFKGLSVIIGITMVASLSISAEATSLNYRCSLKISARGEKNPKVQIINHRVSLEPRHQLDLTEAFAGLSQYLSNNLTAAPVYFVLEHERSANTGEAEMRVSIYRYNAHAENARELVHQASGDPKRFAKLATSILGDNYFVDEFRCDYANKVQSL